MNFVKFLFDFIDTLTIFDVSCLFMLYVIFAVFLFNLWTNMSALKIAEIIHITALAASITTMCLLHFLDKKLFTLLYNNIIYRSTFICNCAFMTIYTIYDLWHKYLDYARYKQLLKQIDLTKTNNANDREYKQDNVNTQENPITKDEIISQQNNNKYTSGTYNNYNYYYQNPNDKYAEPYTSEATSKNNAINAKSEFDNAINNAKRQAVIADSMDTEFGRNIRNKLNTLANEIEQQQVNLQQKEQDIESKIYKRQTDDISALQQQIKELENQYNKEYTPMTNKTQKDNTTITTAQAHDVVIERNKTNEVITANDNFNVVKFEENILDKVKVMMQENNNAIDKKLNFLQTDVGNLKDGVQGMVDRMTKTFELLAVALQGNKQ